MVNVCGCGLLLALKLLSPLYEADMVCVPVSKLKAPFGLAVFPWPFRVKELPPGIAPKLSVNVTVPVGTPYPDSPAMSARKYTKLPKGPLENGIDCPL
jgi:hypothetical protein